jgi:hypothetical protein
MMDWVAIRERYLREGLPKRLGSLAANLGRIRSFASQDAHAEVVNGLMEESKRFIEWTAADTDLGTAAQLVELQVEIARWQRRWERTSVGPDDRDQLSHDAGLWAQRLLDMSGLLG